MADSIDGMTGAITSTAQAKPAAETLREPQIYNTKDACIPDGINREALRAEQATDWRLISEGRPIVTRSYADQPYLVQTDDGALLCVITTGSGLEGTAGQHVTSMRSLDEGKTWEAAVPVESPTNPESSYAVLLKVASGRIYCFYNYNADNLRQIETVFPGNPVTYRVDTLGYYVFRFSDDHGKSWSPQYYKVPVRSTRIDRDNIRSGAVRFFWNVGRPFIRKGAAYLSLHKVGGFGEGFLDSSEGWLIRSDNILSEADPLKLRWETLPEGETGLLAPAGGGRIAEEQSYVVLSDASIYTVYRSVDGYPVESYSRDGGRTWDAPRYKRYADGRQMKNPRAANFVWKCANGKYLHWFHNHGGHFIENRNLDEPFAGAYEDRNPVWISAGVEVDGPSGKQIAWSQPEILFYADDTFIRISYPDMIEINGAMYISETEKTAARLHRIDDNFLQRLWTQFSGGGVRQGVCILDVAREGEIAMPQLPKFRQRDIRYGNGRGICLRQGFTLSLRLRADMLNEPRVLLDNRTHSGRGWFLEVCNGKRLRFVMCDGQTSSLHECACDQLQAGREHALGIIVDGGPCVVSFVVNGCFWDGAQERQFGWSRFSQSLQNAQGSTSLRIAEGVLALQVFSCALMTCEVVALQRD